MSHVVVVVVEQQAAEGRQQCSLPPTRSGAQQVLQGLGQKPRGLDGNMRAHVLEQNIT